MPEVSVIIPNYNHTRFVTAAIDSVLQQSYRDVEIIVVDDGSTDDSAAVIARYGARVRYIYQQNQGLGAARNTGIKAAAGRFVGLLDADDAWLPSYLAHMMTLVARHPDAAVYYANARYMDVNGVEMPGLVTGATVAPDQVYAQLLRANFLIPSTILLRRDVVMAAGLFEQQDRAMHGCEDWDLWLRLAPHHRFVGAYTPLVRYRVHGGSLSAGVDKMQRAARAVVEKHVGVDDGRPAAWSEPKRRAYGGLYRYDALTSVQRQGDWDAAAGYLARALAIDPTLAVDLDLFYDLALGTQPPAFHGTPRDLDLRANRAHVRTLLTRLFAAADAAGPPRPARRTWGTAWCALALAAYNHGDFAASRQGFLHAVTLRPGLWRDPRVRGGLLKSFLGASLVARLRTVRRHPAWSPTWTAERPPRGL